jgi:hypothetical protein
MIGICYRARPASYHTFIIFECFGHLTDAKSPSSISPNQNITRSNGPSILYKTAVWEGRKTKEKL